MGYAGIALLTFAENICPPIPSEVIMPLAGFIAERGGGMTFTGAVVAGTLGALGGAVAWYVLGRRIGERAVRDWIERHGRWLALDGADIDRAVAWFERHGAATVFFCRLIPAVRTFISLPAGFARQPAPTFLAYSAAGTLLWTAALTYAGKVLGRNYGAVSDYLGPVSWVVLAVILGLYIARVARGGARSRRRSR